MFRKNLFARPIPCVTSSERPAGIARGIGALSCLLVASSLPAPAHAVVDSFGIDHIGSYTVTNYDPWVASCWGFVDDQGREFALLAAGNKMLVLDCTNPATPVLASTIAAPITAYDLKEIKTWDHYAYACQEYGDVLIVDISDPYNAVQVGVVPQRDLCSPTPCQFESDGGSHTLWIDENGRLYVNGVHWDSILMYDLTADPTDPAMVGVYTPTDYIHDCYAKDDILYACSAGGAENGWEIVDVSDPGDPVLLGHFTYPTVNYAHSCWVTDDHQWMVTGDEGVGGHLYVWDISSPAAAFPVAEYEVGGGGSSIHNMQIYGDRVYISYYEQGLRVLDFSDPENPAEIAWYKDSAWDNSSCSFGVYRGIWGVYALQPSRNIYLSEMCGGGLHVLQVRDETTSAPAPVPDGLRLVAAPNPALDAVRLSAELGSAGAVTIQIYDAQGRGVRTLTREEERPSGAAAWSWDRRDDHGDQVPAGVYYVRLAQSRRVLTRTVVLQD